jgi:transcriptional regulator with XRE-family HTH domain
MLEDARSFNEYFDNNAPGPGVVRAQLGPRIRRARIQRMRGCSLETFGRQIAAQMGRSRAYSNVTISNWETGRQEPSFEALVAIAHITCLPLRYFAGVGEMDQYPRIDWLRDGSADGRGDELRTLLIRSAVLGEADRGLVLAQLKSLVNDLFSVGSDYSPNG